MSEEIPAPLGEYADANGNTFQLNAEDAKRLGYKRVTAAKAETKVVEAEAETKPPAKRTASTK